MNEAKYFLCRLIYDYLDFLENIKGLSKNTTSSYQRDLKKFSKFLQASGINSFNVSQKKFVQLGLRISFNTMLARVPFKDIFLLLRVFLIILKRMV